MDLYTKSTEHPSIVVCNGNVSMQSSPDFEYALLGV